MGSDESFGACHHCSSFHKSLMPMCVRFPVNHNTKSEKKVVLNFELGQSAAPGQATTVIESALRQATTPWVQTKLSPTGVPPLDVARGTLQIRTADAKPLPSVPDSQSNSPHCFSLNRNTIFVRTKHDCSRRPIVPGSSDDKNAWIRV